MPKVSVIVPAYNVEAYIFRALESVLAQSHGNIELVVVDDGSTDGTWSIIREYAARDSRILTARQENAGVSSARNRALEMSSGEYAVFLDSDDWLEPQAVARLPELAGSAPGTLPAASRYFARLTPSLEVQKAPLHAQSGPERVSQHRAIQRLFVEEFHLESACYKLFDMSLIRREGLRFRTEYHHGEDGLFVFEYLLCCDGLMFSREPLWNILTRPGSATTAPYNAKWLTAIAAAEEMLNHPRLPEEYRPWLVPYVVERIQTVLHSSLRSGPADRELSRKLKNTLLSYWPRYWQGPKKPKSALKYILDCFGPDWLLRQMLRM